MGMHIVIATPGRLNDFLEAGQVRVCVCQLLCLMVCALMHFAWQLILASFEAGTCAITFLSSIVMSVDNQILTP